MRKILTAAAAALTLGGAIAATATPADARPYGYGGYHGGYGGYHGYGGGYRYYGGHHGDAGAAVAAGVVGLALGAAIASSGHHDYGGRYYGGGRYYDGYYGYPGYGYYDDAYRVCESRRWVYDPYIGRRVMVESRYAC